MPKWLSVVFVVIVFLAVGAIVERWRLSAWEAWCRAHGFKRIEPFVPNDHPPIPRLASHVTGSGSNSLRWALAITGEWAGTKVTFAEFLWQPPGRKTTVWFTLAVWPAPHLAGPAVITPGTRNGFGEVPSVWLTDERRRALEAWPHGGEFVLLDGYAGWKTEGLLWSSRSTERLAQLAEARRIFE